MEIRALQARQWPLNHNQLTSGILSSGRISVLQARQWERGVTIDWCVGKRKIQTFKKLPNSRPRTSAAANVAQNRMGKLKDMQTQYTQAGANTAKMLSMDPTLKQAELLESTVSKQALLEHAFSRAVEIMAQLRAPGGCPWDREQTFDSIRRHTLEEAYEVLDAIERKDWPGLKDELGDLLLQVLFYAEMAREAEYFQLQDVIENLNAKLIRRHPHVFANRAGVESASQVLANWEEIKKSERAERGELENVSMLDAVPRNLPALMEASKLGSKAASVGFDWNSVEAVFEKLEEELNELKDAIVKNKSEKNNTEQQEELGDVLFTVVNLARKLGLQAELALRTSNAKFRQRFWEMESQSGASSPLDRLSSAELEELWNKAKLRERKDFAE